MNILVTGGSGFIGSNIVEYHLAKGDKVLAVDDLSTGREENIKAFLANKNFSFEKANILTWANIDKAVRDADIIYHFAAVIGVFTVLERPIETLSINIDGTKNLFEAIARNKVKPTVILASSSSVYGCNAAPVLRETDNMQVNHHYPISTYAISKVAQESVALGFYETHQIPVISVRLFNVIGPRQRGRYGMVVPRFVQQAIEGKPITIFGDGTQTRSFSDVRDVVKAMDLLSQNPKSIGEIVNVGRDHEITIQTLAEIVLEKTNSKSPIQYIPYEEAYGRVYTDYPQRKPGLDKLYGLTKYQAHWSIYDSIDLLIRLYQPQVAA